MFADLCGLKAHIKIEIFVATNNHRKSHGSIEHSRDA